MDGQEMANIGFSIVTAIVAVVALVQSSNQTRLSNKQHLFDKRMEVYSVTTELMRLYESLGNFPSTNYSLGMGENVLNCVRFDFIRLTSTPFLEEITAAIHTPRKEPENTRFLQKLDALSGMVDKMEFLFSGNESVLLVNFVLAYRELLDRLYVYRTVLDEPDGVAATPSLLAEQKEHEKSCSERLVRALDNLENARCRMMEEDTIQKIKMQIKLI